MPRKESGEFEVLLGNKQLLSIFFIVVILLGVFFTMGYILGRSSAPAESSSSTTAKKADTSPVPLAEAAKGQSAFGGSDSPQAAPQVPSPPAETPRPVETQPPPVAAAATPTEPAPGQTFLQVGAVKQPEAEVIADVLKQKGFRSLIVPHPTEPVFRVLVGPLPDADAVAKTRTELENAGFKPIVRKY